MLPLQRKQRIDGERGTAAVQLQAGGNQALILRRRGNDHLPAVFLIGDAGLISPVSGGNQQHAVQRAAIHGGNRHLDMALMNRIKRAAQYPDSLPGQEIAPPSVLKTL